MQTSTEKISVGVVVAASREKVWDYWTDPQHIQRWNAASPDWHTPTATNDLREGGEFQYRMEAKDKSAGFDLRGSYTKIIPNEQIVYRLEDGREVQVTFETSGSDVAIQEIFDPEHENPTELQRAGWQSILHSFKQYVENN